MSPDDRWQEVRRLFDAVVELPPGERDAAVRAAATDDAELRAEVLALLGALTASDGMESGPPLPGDAAPTGERPGMRVGCYSLVREVGHGGMGTVWEGVRADAQFERRVAIKLLRHDLAATGLVERFRRERQILAVLDHPNIARLLDGGTADDGRPFLVMEYVDGEPLTVFAARHALAIRDRLLLFLPVCDAVQHAHRHLVLHRDLKPGNILVTPEGVVKLLDFGIAKLLPDAASHADPAPTTTVRPFTPGYASPEQCRGEPVSTATDVYSLGVVLYELLTDLHPFETANRSPLDLAHALEATPVPPSRAMLRDHTAARDHTAVHVRAALRQCVDAAVGRHAVARRIAGDLDTIVLKAMHREPVRRYTSVEQLADDVRRHLAGQPVRAQPDTLAYRGRKFVLRHRAGVGAAVLVMVSLCGGIAGVALQARAAARERDRARAEADRAQRISDFLAEMLRTPDPWTPWTGGRDVRVSGLLASAAARADTAFADDAEVLARIRTAIGLTWMGLGSFAEAGPLLAAAVQARRSTGPPAALATSLGNYAALLIEQGEYADAEPLLHEAITLLAPRTATDSLEHAALRARLGSVYQFTGRFDAAAAEHAAALALRRRLLGTDHEDVAASINGLAVAVGQRGDLRTAIALHREALDIQRRVKGPAHPDVGAALSNLAFVLAEQGALEAADSVFREALALRLHLLGSEHPDVAWTRYGHATVLLDRGDFAGAEAAASLVLALRGSTLPDAHPIVAASLQVLGRSRAARGRLRSAEPALRESLQLRRANLPADHWLIATAESVLGECLTGAGRMREAEGLLLHGYERLLQAKGTTHPQTRDAARRLADHYTRRGDTLRAATYRRSTP